MSRIKITDQAGAIRSYFPNGDLRVLGNKLIWTGEITPSPNSGTYIIKVKYSYTDGVKVYVVNPKPLPLAVGQTRLEHVYSHEEQRICLYYPDRTEWNSSMWLVQTIFPWASEWLFFYELWLVTGEWLGGGKHHEVDDKIKEEQNDAE